VSVYEKGDKIEANYGAKGEYYPGTINKVPEPSLHPPPPRSLTALSLFQ